MKCHIIKRTYSSCSRLKCCHIFNKVIFLRFAAFLNITSMKCRCFEAINLYFSGHVLNYYFLSSYNSFFGVIIEYIQEAEGFLVFTGIN